MRMKHLTVILAVALVLLAGATAAVSAESTTVNGHCWFDGGETIVSNDFGNETVATSIKDLEPGDDVTFRVEFRNDYSEKTYWYMRSDVLKTLEETYDRSENGGYTFTLTHIKPDGSRQELFSNDTVGGESKVGGMEGLHQATNATKDWFYIQELEPGESADTELYVKFDGDTEVNDYMDTYGKLAVAYAVELDDKATNKRKTTTTTTRTGSSAKTGDEFDPLRIALMMIGSLLLAVALVWSYRRDQRENKKGGDQA